MRKIIFLLLFDWGIETNVSLQPGFVAMIYPVVSMFEDFMHKTNILNLPRMMFCANL